MRMTYIHETRVECAKHISTAIMAAWRYYIYILHNRCDRRCDTEFYRYDRLRRWSLPCSILKYHVYHDTLNDRKYNNVISCHTMLSRRVNNISNTGGNTQCAVRFLEKASNQIKEDYIDSGCSDVRPIYSRSNDRNDVAGSPTPVYP